MKRLPGSLTRPRFHEPTDGGRSAPKIHLIDSSVFFFLVANVLRIAVSSRPTVDTKYPRAQKLCPAKILLPPPYIRAKWIALFPLINPITLRHRVLGRMEITMCTPMPQREGTSDRFLTTTASG